MAAVSPSPDTDRNLLFGVLALQADLLDPPRFAEACAAWAARTNGSLAGLLLDRGWLTEADRAVIEHLLSRRLARRGATSGPACRRPPGRSSGRSWPRSGTRRSAPRSGPTRNL